jgi:hypothetical protein
MLNVAQEGQTVNIKDLGEAVEEYYNRIHLLLSVLAALIVTAICIIKQESLYWMAMWVSVSIISFYIFGLFVRGYIISRIFPPPKPPEPEEEPMIDLNEPAYLNEDEATEPDEPIFVGAYTDADTDID